ncbi:hypothetical protein [Rhizobium sp. Rhizsp82]|uniref:hypothetical protein n=1 Tax=Rhizobium sp. Rhizsp82 TaxID=3243057 RepID=UPI0039B3E63B
MRKTLVAIVGFTIVTLSSCNSVPGASPPGNRKTTASQSVVSGEQIRLGAAYSISQSCTSNGVPTTKVIKAPAHGRVEFKRERVNPPATGNFEKCSARKIESLVAYYTAASGYSGKDTILVRVLYDDGHYVENTINITVIE